MVEVYDIRFITRFITVPLVTVGLYGEFSGLLEFDAHDF
jgi:hypothetical protein